MVKLLTDNDEMDGEFPSPVLVEVDGADVGTVIAVPQSVHTKYGGTLDDGEVGSTLKAA